MHACIRLHAVHSALIPDGDAQINRTIPCHTIQTKLYMYEHKRVLCTDQVMLTEQNS